MHKYTTGSLFLSSHLESAMLHAAYKSEVEASTKTVL